MPEPKDKPEVVEVPVKKVEVEITTQDLLNAMAKEIDHETPFIVEHPEKLPGHLANHFDLNKDADTAPKPDFDPMRRKLATKMVQ